MTMLKKLAALTALICVFISVFASGTSAVYAGENLLNNSESNNNGMYALPTIGEVSIDGDLSDWDWSGRIMVFPAYDTISTKSAEIAAMYDETNLYLGFKVKDQTPLLNTRDPILEPSSTWRGDCFQIRIVSDHCIWVTAAYHKNSDQYSLYWDEFVGMTTNSGTSYQVMYYSKPGSTKLDQYDDQRTIKKGTYCKGIEACAKIDTQSPGTYYYEMKWPSDLIYNDPAKFPKAGDNMIMAFEVYWADETGYNVGSNYKDNLMAGETSRSFFYKKESIWGILSFLGENNIEPRKYVKDKVAPMNGLLETEIEVPKDKDFITVVINDKDGNRIRNAVSEFEYKEYQEYITGESATGYKVKILWDGRDEFGNKVAPGTYTFSTIAYNRFDPVFDTYFYNPGQIPWSTTAADSGWLADHTPPRTVTTYGDEVYVGASFAEGGHGLMALNENDGTKKWGVTFGAYMAQANDKYIYTIPGWAWTQDMSISLNAILVRYDRETGAYRNFVIDGISKPLEVYMSDILGIKNGESVPEIKGLAANNEVIALSSSNMTGKSGMDITNYGTALKYPSAVQILTGEDLKLKKRIYVPDAGALEFSKDGQKLYVISGQNQVADVNIKTGKYEYLPLKGITKDVEFSAITVDNNGYVVLFDKGKDVRGKAYDPVSGRLMYTFGQEGGRPYDGDWKEEGLTKNVSDIAVDGNGDVWVTEDWNYPRRISKWSPTDGKLIFDLIGGTFYMGGGSGINDDDPDTVYWGPVEMKLDRENYKYKVTRILYVPDPLKGEMFPMDGGGNEIVQYFSSDASGEMKNYAFGSGTLYIETESGRYRPCFSIGETKKISYSSANRTPDYDVNKTTEYAAACGRPFSGMSDGDRYLWNDLNMDGKVQEDEIKFFRFYYDWYGAGTMNALLPCSFSWSGRMTKSLSFVAMEGGGYYNFNGGKFGIYKPYGFTKDGAPLYSADSEHMKLVSDPTVIYQASETLLVEDENSIIHVPSTHANPDKMTTAIKAVDTESGNIKWIYRSDYSGVAGSHSAPMQGSGGQIIGPIKILGLYHNSKGDKFFHIRGNEGVDYIMTTDGYYVQTMFQDARLVRVGLPDTPQEAAGKSLNYVSTGGEPFGGAGATQSDGKTRFLLTTGGRCAVVCELTNMDSIERIAPVKYTVTREMLDEAYAYVEKKEEETQGGDVEPAKSYDIQKAKDGFTIDGDLSDWDGYTALRAAIDGATENSNIRIAWNEENLYVSFDTRDDSPMVNNGVDFQKLFKTGDVADIFLSPSGNAKDDAADGDLRLTFSVFDGKDVAVLSKMVDSNAKAGDGTSYSSPVMTLPFDTVKILDDAEIKVIRTDTGYTLEARVPMASLGITPTPDKEMTGDVGIIKGDPEGTVNLARIYYFNKNTGLVSDLPNEARFFPSRWGKMKFVSSDPRDAQ